MPRVDNESFDPQPTKQEPMILRDTTVQSENPASTDSTPDPNKPTRLTSENIASPEGDFCENSDYLENAQLSEPVPTIHYCQSIGGGNKPASVQNSEQINPEKYMEEIKLTKEEMLQRRCLVL